MTKAKRKNPVRIFEKKKSRLDARLREDYIDNGIATIPCRVDDFYDVISKYSVKNYESLSPEFYGYVTSTVETIPPEVPVVLNIVGHSFSEEEQSVIKNTISADFAYSLGLVERQDRRHLGVFLFMLLGTVLTGILISLFGNLEGISTELLFVFFWFFAETFVGYLLLDGHSLRRERITAGRLACVKVVFSAEYDERNYTEAEALEILREISSENSTS